MNQRNCSTIVAPYSGIVLERHVDLGEGVQPGTPLMTGFSLDELRVVANVPQRLIVPVRQHKQARVLLPNDDASINATKLTFFPTPTRKATCSRCTVPCHPRPEACIRACSSRPPFRSARPNA